MISGGGDHEAGRDSIPEIHSNLLPAKEDTRHDPTGGTGGVELTEREDVLGCRRSGGVDGGGCWCRGSVFGWLAGCLASGRVWCGAQSLVVLSGGSSHGVGCALGSVLACLWLVQVRLS